MAFRAKANPAASTDPVAAPDFPFGRTGPALNVVAGGQGVRREAAESRKAKGSEQEKKAR
jgi:hypothetical protein